MGLRGLIIGFKGFGVRYRVQGLGVANLGLRIQLLGFGI